MHVGSPFWEGPGGIRASLAILTGLSAPWLLFTLVILTGLRVPWLRGRVLCTKATLYCDCSCSHALFTCSQQRLLSSYVSRHRGPTSSQDPRSGAGPLCRCAFSLVLCVPSTFSLQLSAAKFSPLLGPLLWFPRQIEHPQKLAVPWSGRIGIHGY